MDIYYNQLQDIIMQKGELELMNGSLLYQGYRSAASFSSPSADKFQIIGNLGMGRTKSP